MSGAGAKPSGQARPCRAPHGIAPAATLAGFAHVSKAL